MKDKKKENKQLTKAEEEVMQIIWKLDRCLVSDIIKYMMEHMDLKKKPPHSTISSIVRILEEKGFVNHKAYGRTYEYFPIITKQDYGKKTLKQLVANYFEGSMDRLVSFMVTEDDINLKDLVDLANQLDDEKHQDHD